MTGHRVLVTGAAGFIGRQLVPDQLRRGRRVRALDQRTEELQELAPAEGLETVLGDIADPAMQQAAVAGVDTVFHLASAHLETGLPEEAYRRINVTALETLLEASRKAGVRRFVHVSSCGVHGSLSRHQADENAPYRPTIMYERTKLEGELLARDFYRRLGLPVVVARPAWVYGPGCKRTARLFSSIARGRFVMIGGGTNLRSAIYITDFLDALELCARQPGIEGEVFILVHDELVDVHRIVAEIARLVGKRPPRIHVPVWAGWVLATLVESSARAVGTRPPISRRTLKFFTNNAAFTSKKARTMLGFQPRVTLRAGLERTHRWWCENGGGN